MSISAENKIGSADKSQRLRMFLPAVLLLLIMVQTFSVAIKDKMHQRIPESLDHYAEAISIVISHVKFNLNGYTGYRNIYDTLIANGFGWDNHENPIVLNEAIQKAKEVSVPGSEYLLFSVNDTGFSDYIRMAFKFFGYAIESFLYLYFLFLFIQVAVFFIEFRRNDLAVAGLVLFLLSHYIIVNGVFGAGYNLWTVHNNRFLSVLGILPLMHICLLAFFQKPLRFSTFFGASVQILIFVFILHCRSSAFWMLGPLFLIGIMWAVKRLKPSVSQNLCKGKLSILADMNVKSWPVIIALGAVFLSVAVKPYILNREYYGEKNIANHIFWYPIYVGLAINPEIRKIYGPRPDTGLDQEEYFRLVCLEVHDEDSSGKAQVRQWLCSHLNVAKPALTILSALRPWLFNYTHNDLDGQRAAVKWLKNNGKTEKHLFTFGPGDKVDYLWWFGEYNSDDKHLQQETLNANARKFDSKKDFKWREMDRIMGLVVKDALIHHPVLVLKTVLIIKLFFFFFNYFMFFLRIQSLLAVVIIIMTLGYLLIQIRKSTLVETQRLLILFFTVFVFSMIVPMTAFPAPHTIADSALLFTLCILGVVLYLINKKWNLGKS